MIKKKKLVLYRTSANFRNRQLPTINYLFQDGDTYLFQDSKEFIFK